MSVKAPKAPPIESFEDGFKVIRATMRGTTYVLKELPADVYEKCLEGSRDSEGTSDSLLLLKLMLDKCLIEPKMTVKEMWELPYPIIRKLNDVVNDLHFSFVETEEEIKERQDDEKGKVAAA